MPDHEQDGPAWGSGDAADSGRLHWQPAARKLGVAAVFLALILAVLASARSPLMQPAHADPQVAARQEGIAPAAMPTVYPR